MTVNMGAVWDRTSEFLRGNVSALAPVALGAIFLPQAVSDVVSQAASAIGTGMAPVIGLLCSLVTLFGQLMIVAMALGPDIGRSAARTEARRGYGRALLVMIVLFAAIAALSLPILGVLAASGADLAQLAIGTGNLAMPDMSPGASAFLGLYVVIVLVVLLFIGARLAPIYPVILAERKALGAIGRSLAVTRGITWKLVGVYLLFFVVFAVAAAAARSVSGVIVGLIAPGDGPFTAAAIVTALVGALISTAFAVVVAAFSARLYRAVTGAAAIA